MIKLAQISKSFGRNQVLNNIDLTVTKGEVVVILGPSGSGKTTSLRCVNYLEKPSSGEIAIGDFKVNCKHARKRRFICSGKKRQWCSSSTIYSAIKPRWRT